MNIIDLIKDFEEDKIIKEGILSVFSDTVGKPGDRILELIKIELTNENVLSFFFGKNEIIQIFNPARINCDNCKIVIHEASRISWKSNNFEFLYNCQNSEIEPILLTGGHVFRIKKGTPAFEFISW